MDNTWNIVEKSNEKIVWKDLEETNFEEIKNIEQILGSEPFYCKHTNSVVFKANPNIKMVKGVNYSELELISRHLTTESKLYDMLKS